MKTNQALEMLSALCEIHNEGETINKNTWLRAEQIVLDHKDGLENPDVKFE